MNFKLITIICEPVLIPGIIKLTEGLGATGFTMTDVRGHGSSATSSGEISDSKVKFEIVSPASLAEQITSEISRLYFKNYSLIIYSADILVARPEKF